MNVYTNTMEHKSLDTVASFMLAEIRLSHYDEQFINNLLTYAMTNNAITSNQDALFKRVSRKYARQFNQHKLNVEELMKLPWLGKVIPSLPEYTTASVTIQDDKIIFRAPYKKEFVSSIRKNLMHGLEWVKEARQYEMSYSLYSLQRIMTLSADHYEEIRYCPTTMQIIERLSEFEDAKYWNPTLVIRGTQFYVLACTEKLYEAIKDIPLEFDLKTLATLAQYGITIDTSVKEYFYQVEPLLKVDFACSHVTTFEHKFVPLMLQWLREFGCEVVAENNPTKLNSRTLREDYVKDLRILGIDYTPNIADIDTANKNSVLLVFRGGVSTILSAPLKLFKIVKLVNSDPVNLGPK